MDKVFKTFGHRAVKSVLGRQLETGKFPHAYLFSGPEGVGKKQLALEFAKKVLKTEHLKSHPDFQLLDMEGEIVMENVLDFISRMSYKPFAASHKVAIVNNAHNLNQQSSNALLKTLEEPGEGSVIILISATGQLLPTIVSRCQCLTFYEFSPNQLKEFAAEQKLTVGDDILEASFGSIARLIRLQSDKKLSAEQQKAIQSLKNIQQGSIADKLMAITEYSTLEGEELEKLFTIWMYSLKIQLGAAPQGFTSLRGVLVALQALKTNKNKKLILQGLFLSV